MNELIPAIMPDTYTDLVKKVESVDDIVDWVQIDVMDKKFVPSLSWPYRDGYNFEKLQDQDEGLPFWEKVNYSIDLMIINPIEEVPKWIEAGAGRVIVHVESLKDDGPEFIKDLKESGRVEVCLAIAPGTSMDVLRDYEGNYDSIQFMGIKNVGFQGEPFDESVLERISNFRKDNPDMPIGIDGGVRFENVEDLIEAGATRIVSGSALFVDGNVRDAILDMKDLLK